MSDRDEELRKAVALFRYGLIADVLRLAPGIFTTTTAITAASVHACALALRR